MPQPATPTTDCRLCAHVHCCLFLKLPDDLRQLACPYTDCIAFREPTGGAAKKSTEEAPTSSLALSGFDFSRLN